MDPVSYHNSRGQEELDQLIAGIQLQNGAIGCVFL